MKLKILLIPMIIFTTSAFAADDCDDKAVTQADMNDCAYSKEKKADEELNQVYQKMLLLAKKDPVATEKIRKAEQAWLKYRDAQIEMYYPPRPEGYGTVQPMCEAALLQKLTENHIKELNEWLAKPEEGELCGRSLEDS